MSSPAEAAVVHAHQGEFGVSDIFGAVSIAMLAVPILLILVGTLSLAAASLAMRVGF